MNVAVIGAGNVGGTLAKKWGAAGHHVVLGVREPSKPELQLLVKEIGEGARATTPAEAVAAGDAVVFAVPGGAMADTVAALGSALSGKIVIDATNNVSRAGGPMNSIAAITAAAPDAHVYRAFNTLGWENFAHADFNGIEADLLYAGPSGETEIRVEQLISDVGLRPIRLGGLDRAPLVDSLLPIWFALASEQGMGRHLAFKVLSD